MMRSGWHVLFDAHMATNPARAERAAHAQRMAAAFHRMGPAFARIGASTAKALAGIRQVGEAMEKLERQQRRR